MVGLVLAEISFRTFGGQWLRGHLRNNLALLARFQDAVGDDARQVALLRAGYATLQFSLQVLGILMGLMAIVGLAPWALQWTAAQQGAYFVTISIIATIWWIVRSRRGRNDTQSTYDPISRWLHWLALEPLVVRQLAFDLERRFALPKRPVGTPNQPAPADPASGAVYVCGLARSGTTMLLRILDELDDFRSLIYRDMPFVLAPNLWKQITRFAPQQAATIERAHGDGIHVGFDSPEGFEEVFWRTFDIATSDSGCLGAVEPSADVLSAFADYRVLVANPRTEPKPSNGILRRYLSKNNNNLLRLHSLCADPTATVLLVYRDPVATAQSLHRQHQRFCAAQTEDQFTRNYMRWLTHHEFGLDHLPFCFAVTKMDSSRTPDDLNYWLDYWNAVYSYILDQPDLKLHLVNHNAMRAQPFEMVGSLFAKLGVRADADMLARQIEAQAPITDSTSLFNPELLLHAEATYLALINSSKNISINQPINT